MVEQLGSDLGVGAEEARGVGALRARLVQEIGKAYVGPAETVEMLLTALIARGHVLIEGIPGVAKTTLVKTFARTLGCTFRRIQFTPDLLPSDITGTYILDMKTNAFVLREGPIFANVVLGDEINRAPAKSQSALLEAMQESQVTIDGTTRALDLPFMVLATQNPIEHEGTYRLPEAQIDRFVLKLSVGYPRLEHERQMMLTYSRPLEPVDVLLSPTQVLQMQALADRVHVQPELIDYIIALARFCRDHKRIYLGVSPRASLMLLRVSKARALLQGRSFVLPDDIKALAIPVMAHRMLLTPEAEMDGVAADMLVREALETVRYQHQR